MKKIIRILLAIELAFSGCATVPRSVANGVFSKEKPSLSTERLLRHQQEISDSGWGKKLEMEADRYGAELAAKAGYNPYAFSERQPVSKTVPTGNASTPRRQTLGTSRIDCHTGKVSVYMKQLCPSRLYFIEFMEIPIKQEAGL